MDAAFCQRRRPEVRGVAECSFSASQGGEAMHFAHHVRFPVGTPPQWAVAEGDATLRMATPPISETHIEIASRKARVFRWLHARAAWLLADVVAISACAVLFLRALT